MPGLLGVQRQNACCSDTVDQSISSFVVCHAFSLLDYLEDNLDKAV